VVERVFVGVVRLGLRLEYVRERERGGLDVTRLVLIRCWGMQGDVEI